MSRNYHNEAPYNDDYDPSKNYTQILAVPGRAEQAREFTQLSSIQLDYLGRLGDAVFSDGSIIKGCTLVVHENQAIISSGELYLGGLVRKVNGVTIDIAGVGSEVIGAKIASTVITETEDPTLRDPAQGYLNFGLPGAHRVKETVEFTLDDSTAATIYRLEDGNPVVDASVDNSSLITEILARRTYDENGNYKVSGLDLRARNEISGDKILVSLTSGKAYIQGFEVTKPYVVAIPLDYSKTVRQVYNEPKIYRANTDKYELNNSPIKEFTQVTCEIEVEQSMVRGSIGGGMDFLPKTPVVEIVEVKQGNTTYVSGTDYQLVNDAIDWSRPGAEPSIGSTYQVTYRYNKVMVIGTDVALVTEDGVDYLEFLGVDTPVPNSQFTVDYLFYLARKDLITLDSLGNYHVVPGKPDIIRLAETPLNSDPTRIIIGSVLVYPNSSTLEVVNFYTTRLTQHDLYNMYRRVNDIEYNQAMTNLDEEAANGEAATDLKGIYTDGFMGITKCDTGHTEFDCTIDVDLCELTLPTVQSIDKLNPNLDSYETNVSVVGRIITAPFEHQLAFQQKNATGVMLVNPYAVYNPMCPIRLNPEVDNWIDSEVIEVQKEKTTAMTLRRWWYHRGESWAEEEKAKWEALGLADGGASLGWNGYNTSTSVTNSEVVLDEAIMFMRSTVVEVEGHNFTPMEDNIKCYFNDTEVPLTVVSGTAAGTMSGTVKANTKGYFKAKFTVLKNTPCGSVSVKLKGATSEGTATYRAEGRQQLIQDTVLTTNVAIKPVDPLAQTFSFDNDTVLTQVGLYFASKDPSKAVVIQIRDVVNGYPGTTCYDEITLTSDEISVSEKGTVATLATFNQPVYCNADVQYCVCILSDSNLYSVFTATLGEVDLITENFVTSQPYEAGVLFSSSNALTWTAHQTMDLKFDLYKSHYTGTGSILFDNVSSQAMQRVVLAAQSLDYKNAGLDWLFRLTDDSTWLPIDAYVDRSLDSISSTFQLKAILNVAYSASPIIAGDCINLISFVDKSEGAYVSKTVTMSEEFTNIRLVLESCLPSGTAIRPYYMTEDTSGWVQITSNPTVTQIDTEFSQYEWLVDDLSAKTYKLKIELETSNPLVGPRVRKLMSILKY